MRYHLYITFVFIVMSCSTSEEKRLATWESWNGLSVNEIGKHSYFKHLKVSKIRNENGPETWIYKDQTPFPTSAYCGSLGGCQGRTFYNCESAFSVEDGKILGLEQTGTCPGLGIIEANNSGP